MMNDKEILANAPDGAVCVDADYDYFNVLGVMWCQYGKRFKSPYRTQVPCRLLADIRALVEKDERIKELEKECEELSAFKVIFGMGDGESVVTARQYINSLKLEQQAKGIDLVIECRENNLSNGEIATLMDKCNALRIQAKQLREGIQP